jgi:YVTN family beta-propeller protein
MLTTLRRIASQAADFSIAVALVTGCMMQGSSPAASAETQSAVTSDSAKVVATITVGSEPFDLAVTPDGNDVYVVNYASSSVSVINASLNTVVGTVALGSQDGPTRVTITPDGTSALVLAGTNIYVISTSTNTLVNTIALGSDFGMGLPTAHSFMSRAFTEGSRSLTCPPIKSRRHLRSGMPHGMLRFHRMENQLMC